MSAIFEDKCKELGVKFDVVVVKKTDPKSKSEIWSSPVAFPSTVEGFVKLIGENRAHYFLVDKTSIWLRAQHDPRKPERTITIDGVKVTEEELREFKAWKASKAGKTGKTGA